MACSSSGTGMPFYRNIHSESEQDFKDAFIKRLQDFVREVKASREMGARHMIFQEMLKDEREAGRQEGLQVGRQEGLRTLVETCQEFGRNLEETIGKVVEKFQVSKEDAKAIVEKYWKELAK